MFDLDHWQEIWHALKSNRLRTLLTAFGVFWGICLLVILLGSGNGLRRGLMQEMGGRATNTFFLWTQRTSKPYRGLPPGRWFRMNNGDVDAMREGLPEARYICPRNQLGGYGGANNVTRGTEAGAFNVYGDYPEIEYVEGIRVTQGRFLNRLDLSESRKVAVIGEGVRQVLFKKDEEPLGDSIQIQGVHFKVIGIHASTRGGDRADEEDRRIYIPFTTFQRAFNFGDRVSWFAVTSRDDVSAKDTEEKALALLRERHRIHPDDQRAFGHFNMAEEFSKIRMFFLGVDTLTWLVGIGTLIAGVIGVSNIMLIIVRERTKEIGIRRAVGARPRAIVGQILLESIILTSVAGYLGLVAGVAITELASAGIEASGANLRVFRHPGIDFFTALLALSILVASGALAGLLPARRALAIHPVEALRAE